MLVLVDTRKCATLSQVRRATSRETRQRESRERKSSRPTDGGRACAPMLREKKHPAYFYATEAARRCSATCPAAFGSEFCDRIGNVRVASTEFCDSTKTENFAHPGESERETFASGTLAQRFEVRSDIPNGSNRICTRFTSMLMH